EERLEARLGAVERALLRFPRAGALFVEAERARGLSRARRELRFEAVERGALPRRQRRALIGERVDGPARTRVATEVEIEVGEAQERALPREEAARAATHVE